MFFWNHFLESFVWEPFLGIICGDHFFGDHIFWDDFLGIFFWGSFFGDHSLGDHFSGIIFLGDHFLGIIFGGSFFGDHFLGIIFRGSFFGDHFLGGHFELFQQVSGDLSLRDTYIYWSEQRAPAQLLGKWFFWKTMRDTFKCVDSLMRDLRQIFSPKNTTNKIYCKGTIGDKQNVHRTRFPQNGHFRPRRTFSTAKGQRGKSSTNCLAKKHEKRWGSKSNTSRQQNSGLEGTVANVKTGRKTSTIQSIDSVTKSLMISKWSMEFLFSSRYGELMVRKIYLHVDINFPEF